MTRRLTDQLKLFDMDGTIVDSTDAIVKFWRNLGKKIGVSGDCKPF